jgi:serine/threonine-protein kinase HipA
LTFLGALLSSEAGATSPRTPFAPTRHVPDRETPAHVRIPDLPPRHPPTGARLPSGTVDMTGGGKKRGRGPRHPAPLVAWIDDQVVGEWSVREGEHRFRYAEAWAAASDAGPLSLSLPFAPDGAPLRGEVVRDWFDNLLPDGDAPRRRLRERLGIVDADAFDLLTVLGRDCVGAIRLLPPGEAPTGFDRIDAVPLDEAGVERIIDAALASGRRGRSHADDDSDEVRVALPGTQDKTALLRRDGRWFRPQGATPTTHLLKLSPDRVDAAPATDPHASVHNEWLCSRVLSAFGLPVAACELARFGRHEVLVVERFDRVFQAGDRIARLPQEDLCQALGVPGTRRYEADGGPGLRDILRVLDAGTNASADKAAFVKAQMVFWLLAATDGHAKNFSIVLERGGGHRLAPFYDVHSAWPAIGDGAGRLTPQKARLALALRGRSAHWGLTDIGARQWDDVARLAGLGDARSLCDDIAERLPHVLGAVEAELPPDFPTPLADAVFGGMKTLAPRLRDAG